MVSFVSANKNALCRFLPHAGIIMVELGFCRVSIKQKVYQIIVIREYADSNIKTLNFKFFLVLVKFA